MLKVGFGGGCHWCTEGVFQSLKGILKVEQGWISSLGDNSEFSEGVIVHFNTEVISLEDLIEIHLYTHSSTSNHHMRNKYRSAVYSVSEKDRLNAKRIIQSFQKDFREKIVTQSLHLNDFKENEEKYLNYLYSRPGSGFCATYIHPKLRFLMDRFSDKVQTEKLNEIGL
ncbi:MAG: peptide-methionine (S)-S-oxide reductase [Crocinitomicaceae bacterium]|nr:peptide-methionine (S)-S-oxide reductase [Flavobacteriales bacterium]NQZ35045.1 peptide-methionine (S)-S-oxide reductase [Crocinitomicaceae bacterium]